MGRLTHQTMQSAARNSLARKGRFVFSLPGVPLWPILFNEPLAIFNSTLFASMALHKRKKIAALLFRKTQKFNHVPALNFNNYFAKNKSNGEKLSKRLLG